MGIDDIFIPHLIFMAKQGHQHSAQQLIKILRNYVAKNMPLPATLQPYILEALSSIIEEGKSADLALHLKHKRGGKTPVHYRNIRIAFKVTKLINEGMKPSLAYEEVAKQAHDWESCPPVHLSAKMIKEIYLKYK